MNIFLTGVFETLPLTYLAAERVKLLQKLFNGIHPQFFP